jgi:hypothetical protein
MTEELYTLYYDLMVNFPFSITGYDDIESKISSYFERFCNHSFNKLNKDISFIVGIFGQLSGLEEINPDTIDKINDWETDKIKKFLFCNYEGDRSALVMSFYIHQLQSLLSGRYATNVLTGNFRNDVDFRVSLTDDEKPNTFFRRNERIFEIKVPKSIYQDEIFKSPSEIFKTPSETRNILREKLQNYLITKDKDNLLAKHDFINSYELEIVDETNETITELYEKLSKEIYSKTFDEFYKSNEDYLVSEFNNDLVKRLIFKNANAKIDDLLKVAYAGSFLCAYYGVDLEYILSTCRVVGKKEHKKKYGLGGLAVGVKNNCDFTLSHRAFYKIISNQIASNLSGQITYDLFSSEVYKEKAGAYLQDLCKDESPFIKLTHLTFPYDANEVEQLKNEAIEKLESLFFKKIISQDTYDKAIGIIKRMSPDIEITTDIKEELEGLFRLKLNKIIDKYKNHFSVSIEDFITSDMANDTIEYHFDFDWLINLLKRIPYNNFITHVANNGGKLQIEISTVGANDIDAIECNNDEGSHYLRIRLKDNGEGMDLLENIKNSTHSYSLLHRGKHDYEVLKTHGNAFVHSKGKAVSILELHKEDVKDSEVVEGTVFEILLKK